MNSIGIEISKNKATIGICKIEDRVNVLGTKAIPLADSFEKTLSDIAEAAKALMAEFDLLADKIGIAVDANVTETFAYGSVFGNKVNFNELKKYIDIDSISVVKTANALALAEEKQTYGKGYSFAYVCLDEKIGFGFLIDSVPFTAGGLAVDIAHTAIQHSGKKCSCGNTGCFEAYCSLDEYDGTEHNEYVKYLSCGITNVMNLFQPNVLVVGGKVMDIGGEELLKECAEIVYKENYARNSEHKTKLVLPSVTVNAAVIGAAIV